MEREEDVSHKEAEAPTSEKAEETMMTEEKTIVFEPTLIEQLRIAETWCDCDSEPTIPVEREHGKWLFKTAADRIEQLETIVKELTECLDAEFPPTRKIT